MWVTQLIQDSWLCKSYFSKDLRDIKLSYNQVKVISLSTTLQMTIQRYEKKAEGVLHDINKFEGSVLIPGLSRAL